MRVYRFKGPRKDVAIDLDQVQGVGWDSDGELCFSMAGIDVPVTPGMSFEQAVDLWQNHDKADRPPRAAFDESWEHQTQADPYERVFGTTKTRMPYDGDENPIKLNCPGCGEPWGNRHTEDCPIAQGVNSGVAAATIGARLDEINNRMDALNVKFESAFAAGYKRNQEANKKLDDLNEKIEAIGTFVQATDQKLENAMDEGYKQGRQLNDLSAFTRLVDEKMVSAGKTYRGKIEGIEKTLDTILARLATIQPNGGNAPGPFLTRAEAMKALEIAVEEEAEREQQLGDYTAARLLRQAFKRLKFP
jgi:hypothetical protein